ncbi:MAG: hypothetical protein RI894_1311 [Bacteroidota bacterium]|jgi:hypothetical protein
MKKIVLLATFVIAAFTANAQCSGGKTKACCAAKGPASALTEATTEAGAKPVATEVSATGEAKKTCTASQAKSCTKEDMKKGCCAKKAAAAEVGDAKPAAATGVTQEAQIDPASQN